jgi:hypothetical protein
MNVREAMLSTVNFLRTHPELYYWDTSAVPAYCEFTTVRACAYGRICSYLKRDFDATAEEDKGLERYNVFEPRMDKLQKWYRRSWMKSATRAAALLTQYVELYHPLHNYRAIPLHRSPKVVNNETVVQFRPPSRPIAIINFEPNEIYRKQEHL